MTPTKIALFLAFFLFASTTSAQDAGTPPALEPPSLAEFAEATYPAEAQAAGTTARVELQLTIAPDGTVSDAQVTTPVGQGFDEAALEAARRFRFNPARRNGTPITARIRYTYVFEIRVEATPVESVAVPSDQAIVDAPSEATRPGRLEGRVLDEDDDALAGAEVALLGEADAVLSAVVTDAQGAFAFEDLRAGALRVRVTLAEHETLFTEETVAAGEATSITYRMRETTDREAYRAVARVDPLPREVTRRTIESVELTNVAGTRGDALRVIELLPGVGRPPGLAGLVLIRGSAPGDSQVYLEGMPVPLLYHFGGLTSFFASRMIDRIDFYPGNFSVRYGRKVGGVIDVGVRDPRTDGYHGVVDINLIDASFIAEGPIGNRASFAVAARRSYVDFWFSKVLPRDVFNVVAAPVYYDYQGIFSWRPTSRDRVRLMAYGSSDRFEAVFPNPSDNDPAFRGNLDLSTAFYRGQFDWRHKISDTVEQNIEASFGVTDLRIGVGDIFRLNLRTYNFLSRAEWTARLSPRVRFIGGMDIQVLPTTIAFYGPPLGQSEGDPSSNNTTDARVSGDFNITAYRPAAYAEVNLRPWDPFQMQLGIRLDYAKEIRRWNADPRMSMRYTINEHWTIKGGVGLFSQPPEFSESARTLGNPNLLPTRSVHASAGVDHTFNEVFSLGVEGFFKHLFDRVVSTPNGLPPTYNNDGIGRIYGLEVSGRARPKGRFFGFLSYTLSRSERRDRDGDWRVFDFDQTHIFTLSGSYRLGRGWEIGGTFRLVTGNPQTPVSGSVYDARSDVYQPLYGLVNSTRSGYFHRLDIRVEKTWRFDAWSLALYLDVQNVYNRQNPEGTIYNFDYRQSSVIGGLPILPSLGLRGEI